MLEKKENVPQIIPTNPPKKLKQQKDWLVKGQTSIKVFLSKKESIYWILFVYSFLINLFVICNHLRFCQLKFLVYRWDLSSFLCWIQTVLTLRLPKNPKILKKTFHGRSILQSPFPANPRSARARFYGICLHLFNKL